MSRVWFARNLETVATFWRVYRRDGVALGFTTHDRDLWLAGIAHRAMPGMLPSAIRRSGDLEPDTAEVEGALSHASINPQDLASGRFDGARVAIGLVDWETLESFTLYNGAIGTVTEEAGQFNAQLMSRKSELQRDTIARTSPTCRADFCGPECGLSPARFTHFGKAIDHNTATNTVTLDCAIPAERLVGGHVRWLDGPACGTDFEILSPEGASVLLGAPIDFDLPTNGRVQLREGCDRTLATCADRFDNAINFQGEPHVPGNDLIARYPTAPA